MKPRNEGPERQKERRFLLGGVVYTHYVTAYGTDEFVLATPGGEEVPISSRLWNEARMRYVKISRDLRTPAQGEHETSPATG